MGISDGLSVGEMVTADGATLGEIEGGCVGDILGAYLFKHIYIY